MSRAKLALFGYALGGPGAGGPSEALGCSGTFFCRAPYPPRATRFTGCTGWSEGASSTVLLAEAPTPDDRGDHSAWKLQRGGIRHAGKRAQTGVCAAEKMSLPPWRALI